MAGALPLLLLALDQEWLVSGPHPDYWIYYGWFRNGLAYLGDIPAHYHSSRLSVTLPGMAFHHAFGPAVANVLLHLTLYWLTLAAFVYTATALVGRRAAILAMACLGLNPFLAQALGKNYVDGFGICYLLLAAACLIAAARGKWRPLWLVLAGCLMMAVVSANLLFVLFLPAPVGLFLVVDRPWSLQRLAATTGWVASGSALVTVELGLISGLRGNYYFFLAASIGFARQLTAGVIPDVWSDPASEWLPRAFWLVIPAAIALGSIAYLLRRRWHDSARPDVAIACQLQYLALGAVVLLAQLTGKLSLLQHFYATSILLPLGLVALAGQLEVLVERLSRRAFALAVGFAVALAAVPWALDVGRLATRRILVEGSPAPLTLVAAAGAGALLLRRPGPVAVMLPIAALVTVQGAMLGVTPERDPGLDHWGRFRQIATLVETIERHDDSLDTRLWYTLADPAGPALHAAASSFMLCTRLVSLELPEIASGRLCDNTPLAAGQRYAVLSTQPAAAGEAARTLERFDLTVVAEGEARVRGPFGDVLVSFLRTERPCPPTR